jgi:hypothetical protein
MMTVNECYRLLELEPGATASDVKRAYHEMINIWHPDRFQHDKILQKKASEKTKLLNVAFKTLEEAAPWEKKHVGAESPRVKPRPTSSRDTAAQQAYNEPPLTHYPPPRASPKENPKQPQRVSKRTARIAIWSIIGVAVCIVVIGMFYQLRRSILIDRQATVVRRLTQERDEAIRTLVEAREKWIAQTRSARESKIQKAQRQFEETEKAYKNLLLDHAAEFAQAGDLTAVNNEQAIRTHEIYEAEFKQAAEYDARQPERVFLQWMTDQGAIVIAIIQEIAGNDPVRYELFADTRDPHIILGFLTDEQAGLPEYSGLARTALVLSPGPYYFPHLKGRILNYGAQWDKLHLIMFEAVRRYNIANESLRNQWVEMYRRVEKWRESHPVAVAPLPEFLQTLLKQRGVLLSQLNETRANVESIVETNSTSALESEFLVTADGQQLQKRITDLEAQFVLAERKFLEISSQGMATSGQKP